MTGVTEGATYNLGSDAQGVGEITAICSGALDSAGNVADPAVVHFTVVNPVPGTCNFASFFQPVDNPGPSNIFNNVKASSTVPVKFSLGSDQSDQGLSIFSPGSPASRPVSCTAAAHSDPIEETVIAGSSPESLIPPPGVSEVLTYSRTDDGHFQRFSLFDNNTMGLNGTGNRDLLPPAIPVWEFCKCFSAMYLPPASTTKCRKRIFGRMKERKVQLVHDGVDIHILSRVASGYGGLWSNQVRFLPLSK